ncbi:unnamed protein product [Dracunculus medinensis]|uniref:Uncharacterized protein n=1 Tax=Dracunculus medinensis TaxID=318479 RepID=A0A0N4UMQ9_DRAME|nr:unnamed protein product [Dracunculus medinensis]
MQKDCSDSCEEVLNEISRQIVDSILKNDLIHEKETNVLTKMEDSGELIDLKKSKIDNSTAVVENGTIVVSITNGDKTDVKVYEMQDGNSKIKEDKNGNRLNQSNQEIDEADNEKISDLLVKDSNSNKINDKDNKKPESANDSDKEGKGSNKIVHTGGGDIDDLVGETFHKVITTMLTDVCLFSHFSNFIDGGFKVHLT